MRHGFLLGAESLSGDAIEFDTGVAPWLGKILGGTSWHNPLCAWGTGWNETVRAAEFPWNWQRGAGGDWSVPDFGPHSARAGSQVEIGSYHRLRPASLPPMLDEPRDVGRVRHVSAFEKRPLGAMPIRDADNLAGEIAGWQGLIRDGKTLTIAPHTKRRVIVDLENYGCARLELQASDGQGARVDVCWSEALYDDLELWSKGFARTESNRRNSGAFWAARVQAFQFLQRCATAQTTGFLLPRGRPRSCLTTLRMTACGNRVTPTIYAQV